MLEYLILEVNVMGLDLTLFPIRLEQLGETEVFCYDRLSFDRDYEIFDQLIKIDGSEPTIRTLPIPPQLWVSTYGEEGSKRTRNDKYGTELTFVYAETLKQLKIPESSSAKNKAIKAFIDALPNDIPIILLWS